MDMTELNFKIDRAKAEHEYLTEMAKAIEESNSHRNRAHDLELQLHRYKNDQEWDRARIKELETELVSLKGELQVARLALNGEMVRYDKLKRDSEEGLRVVRNALECINLQKEDFQKLLWRSQSELADLKAKQRPEPDVGEGFEFCLREDATEATCWGSADKAWKSWQNVRCWNYDSSPDQYRYRRPKQVPWVACTAKEAEEHPNQSETFVPLYRSEARRWKSCASDCGFGKDLAYRTKATLPDYVILDWWTYKSRVPRSTIKLGTVLG